MYLNNLNTTRLFAIIISIKDLSCLCLANYIHTLKGAKFSLSFQALNRMHERHVTHGCIQLYILVRRAAIYGSWQYKNLIRYGKVIYMDLIQADIK